MLLKKAAGVMALFVFLFFFTENVGALNGDDFSENCNEVVSVVTDRDIYIAGESMFFNSGIFHHKTQAQSKIMNLVLLDKNHQAIYETSGRLNNNSYASSIYIEDTLQTGFYQLVGFTNYLRNQPQECYGHKHVYIVNRFDKEISHIKQVREDTSTSIPTLDSGRVHNVLSHEYQKTNKEQTITIKPAKTVVDLREKMDVHIRVNDSTFKAGIYSVSVSPVHAFFQQNQPPDKTFAVEKSPQNKHNRKFLTETASVIFSGRVWDKALKQYKPNVSVVLTTPDTIASLMYTKTNQDGRFFFLLNDYYLGKEVFLSFRDFSNHDHSLDIQLDNRYENTAEYHPPRYDFRPQTRDYVLTSQEVIRAVKAYSIDLVDTITTDKWQNFAYKVYSTPDHTVIPSEYEPLDDFMEISRELLYPVRSRHQDEGYSIRLLNEREDFAYFDNPPAIFLDGLLLHKANQRVMDLNSPQIDRIETKNTRWAVGDLAFDGVVSIFLTDDEYRDYTYFLNGKNVQTTQLKPNTRLMQPKYNKQENPRHHKPDLRQLLYWSPGINGLSDDFEFSFYTSDLEGNYRITIKGMLPDGRVIEHHKDFIVKPAP